MEGRRLTLAVAPAQAGKTVDTLLRRELGLSGTGVKHAKTRPDGILLNGIPVRTSERAGEGQTLSVFIGDLEESGLVPAEGPLAVVHEDEDLLVVNKAAGMAVHPGPGHFDDTLGNIITAYYKKQGLKAGFHPVSRLDRGTSGLLMVAKHAYAQERMKARLHTDDFRRWYLAVCEGVPPAPKGRVEAPIGRADGSVLKREVRPDGQAACTEYEVLAVYGGRALVRAELKTGRTHQIRVHMAHLGCPLTGDFLYGVEDRRLIARTALHSAGLVLCHPVTGARLRFTAPLPGDMAALLDLSAR